MKKLFLIVFLLLLALPAHAQMLQGIMGGGVAAAGNFCDGYSGLFCEDFESNQTCGDDAASQANCRASWTSGGSSTITNQATGLAGTYAKSINADVLETVTRTTYVGFTASSPVYAFAIVNINTLTLTGNILSPIIGLSTTATTQCYLDVVVSTGFKWRVSSNWDQAIATSGPSQSTSYCVWLEYTQNTQPATTGCVAYIATYSAGSCTKPAATVSASTYGATTCNRLSLGAIDQVSFGDVDNVSFDNIKVKATAIGDSGQ